MTTLETAVLRTPIGWLTLTATADALQHIQCSGSRPAHVPAPAKRGTVLTQAMHELEGWLAGKQTSFTVPLRLTGTPFQQRVWAALQRVPHGSTLTYGELARQVRCRSPRAIGQAVGANPICIIIPCHRIVASQGLGGFAFGLPAKRWLLKHEGIPLPT
jgi:methylated-DNA-[protein]-cysteine S-methyltransferase